MASQITSLTVVYSIVYSDADQGKHPSSASLASVRGIHRDRWITSTAPVNSPHKGPVTRKMLPFDDLIMWPSLYKIMRTLQWMSRQKNYVLHREIWVEGRLNICILQYFVFMDKGHGYISFCVNSSPPSAAYMRQLIETALVQIMASRLFGGKPLSEPMLHFCQLDPSKQTSVKF